MSEDRHALINLIVRVTGESPDLVAADPAWRVLIAAAAESFTQEVDAVLEAESIVALNEV